MKDLDYITRFQAQCRGAEPSPADDATDFYLRAARSRRAGVLRSVFPRLLRALDRQRSELIAAYRYAETRDEDWYRNGAVVPALVESLLSTTDFPPWAGELAHHEWALFEVGLVEADPAHWPAQGLNPTLRALEVQYDWPRWLSGSGGAPLRADDGPVYIGYYQDPSSRRGRWIELSPYMLAAMRVVQEGLSAATVADAIGADAGAIQAALDDLVVQGLALGAE